VTKICCPFGREGSNPFLRTFLSVAIFLGVNNSMTDIIVPIVQSQPWFPVVTAVVTLASAIAAITPTPKQGSKLAKAYKIIDFLALNFGKAKQK
jgi:hypothetical protein